MDVANYRGISLLSLAGKFSVPSSKSVGLSRKRQRKPFQNPRQASEPAEALWTNSSLHVDRRKNTQRLGAHFTAAIGL